jgi:Domain of unknown function (DUF4912)
VLRIYDTTYSLFDGMNANWWMDVTIHRPSNNHYVLVNQPGATLHVDIGVKAGDGAFATIARSAAIEMPRSSVSADTHVEWMTVQHDDAPPAAYAHRFVPRPWTAPAAPPGPDVEVDRIMQALAGPGWSRTEWTETRMGDRVVRWLRSAGHVRDAWGIATTEIVFQGGRRVEWTEQGERVVLGPWRVTIYSLPPDTGQHVISRWEIHYSWLTEQGGVRIETLPILARILGGYRATQAEGGSEARLLAESWASESLQMGASEWQWLGGSELWLAGASEILAVGASEVLWLGATEWLFAGASERWWIGASESWLGGASEALGASEAMVSSEALLGRAIEAPGASELLQAPSSEERP